MSNLKIKDAPILPALIGSEKIPTGGRGNFTTSADQLKDYIAKDLQVNVDAEVSRLDAVDVMLDARIYSNTLDISKNTGRIATVEAKVSTVAIGATANATNAQLRDRTTHTGVQPISSVSNLQTELNNRSLVGHTHTQQQVSGLATRLVDIENSVTLEAQERTAFDNRKDNPHQVTAAQIPAGLVGGVVRTQADKNADFITQNDGFTGGAVTQFLPQKTIAVTTPPQNLWGVGLTKQVNRVSRPEFIPYPLSGNTTVHAVDTDKNHKGLNSHMFINPASGEMIVVYRTSSYHGVCTAEFIARSSFDNGQTWSNPTSVYSATGLDTRCSVSIQEGSLCIINLITRNPADLTYGDAKSLVSNDYGKTWTAYDIANPTGRPINFHGNLVRFGSKIIGYSYANAGNVDAYWTEDNGQTWTFVAAAIAKNVDIPSLSECTVVKVGSVGVAIMRTGNQFSGVSVNNNGDGLTWSSPVRSTMPMGTNPYSGIIDGGISWVLFCDRKQNSGIVQDRGVLFALKIDQAFINSNFLDFGFYEVCQTPFYSVTHPFGFKDLNGRWCATFNGGEQDGTSAALYVMTYAKSIALSKTAVLDAVRQPNLLVDGGFNLTRISAPSTTYTGNYRKKYFSDGWAFIHPSAGTVTFRILPDTTKNTLNSQIIKSSNYLRIDCAANQTAGALVVSNHTKLGNFGFRGALTVSFYARVHDAGVSPLLSVSTQRFYADQALSDTKALLSNVVLSTYWKKFTKVAYFENTISAVDADYANGYDALNIVLTPNAAGDIKVDIADVKIEYGERATEFDADTDRILTLANQYYYPTSGNVSSASGSVRRRHYATGTFVDVIEFRRTMQKVPTVLTYSTSGLANRVRNTTSNADVAMAVVDVTTDRAVFETADSVAGGANIIYHYVLDARPTV